MDLTRAYGNTNIDKNIPSNVAPINAMAASINPKIQNNNLTVNNQIMPSKSKVKSNQGI